MIQQRVLVPLVAFVAACVCGIVVAVLLLSPSQQGDQGTTSETSSVVAPPQQQTPPQVLTLEPGLLLITHESSLAETAFEDGVLLVSLPVKISRLRWVHGAAPSSGGRLDALQAPFASLPAGLPVVVSYDTESGPLSLFGRLAAAPALATTTVGLAGSTLDDSGSDLVRYSITLYDAPGKDSTYTISGSYDIPEVLRSVRIVIAGQATK
jgi:hypothetical protein